KIWALDRRIDRGLRPPRVTFVTVQRPCRAGRAAVDGDRLPKSRQSPAMPAAPVDAADPSVLTCLRPTAGPIFALHFPFRAGGLAPAKPPRTARTRLSAWRSPWPQSSVRQQKFVCVASGDGTVMWKRLPADRVGLILALALNCCTGLDCIAPAAMAQAPA